MSDIAEQDADNSAVLREQMHPLKLFDIAKAEGRPLYAAAPMVRYSKLAFRQTVHDYGVDLCWTPMILAKEFNRSVLARDSDFTLPSTPFKIPTIIQLGSSSPLEFSRATSLAAPYVSGIDLNCGCPQSWTCAENLGAALMNKREVVAQIVKEAKATLEREGWAGMRTVSVKIRIHKDLRETIDFIRTVQSAGASFLTIHARTRSQRSSTPASLSAVSLLTSHCSIPVISNGDVTSLSTAQEVALTTGAQGVMAARSLLSNPALFAGHATCPWEAVEKFMSYVVRAPIPFKLVVHHLTEMCGSSGHGADGRLGISGGLLSKKERSELVACGDMLELMDWLDGVRDLRRF